MTSNTNTMGDGEWPRRILDTHKRTTTTTTCLIFASGISRLNKCDRSFSRLVSDSRYLIESPRTTPDCLPLCRFFFCLLYSIAPWKHRKRKFPFGSGTLIEILSARSDRQRAIFPPQDLFLGVLVGKILWIATENFQFWASEGVFILE